MELQVAVPTPVHGTFTYLSEREIVAGTRVLVPFAGRKLIGVVVGPRQTDSEKAFKLKRIIDQLDEEPSYSTVLVQLAHWMSDYYLHPIGEVLRAMLPASQKTSQRQLYQLSPLGLKTLSPEISKVLQEGEWSKSTLRARLKEMCPEVDLEQWIGDRLIEKRPVKTKRARHAEHSPIDVRDERRAFTPPRILNPMQKEAFESLTNEGLNLLSQGVTPKPFLIRGVTGAGKTELYLQAIQQLWSSVDPFAQALVMVPEIALTPQMTQIFIDRFGALVAVVHSAMNDRERWKELNRIRTGQAKILIGPRSAVFGPFQSLRLIVVDEEHDASYKQQSGLLYSGRDVAIVRAKMEGAMVVLGSATPSLESYHNAQEGKYHLIELTERVTGRPLPIVHRVESQLKKRSGTLLGASVSEMDIPIADEIIEALRDNLKLKQQSIVLVNRRGFAHYLFSLQARKAVACPQCSISLTLHRRSTLLRCHYCDFRKSVESVIKERPQETFASVGFGSEQMENILEEVIPGAVVARLDSDTVSDREKLPELLDQFRAGKIDILVGTQILAKGHDFPNVTLMAILEIDQLLDLPDFRASERCFQLIVQAAGRAGRSDLPGRVFLQSARHSDATVSRALTQDFVAFSRDQLEQRKMLSYPPYSRQVYIELSSSDQTEIDRGAKRVEHWFEEMAKLHPDWPKCVRVLGPSAPAIEMLRGRYRRGVLMSSKRIDILREMAKCFAISFQKLGGDLRMKIDVDPQSIC